MIRSLIATILGLIVVAAAPLAEQPRRQAAPKAPRFAIDEVEGLPRVLLLGDSISIGYTRMVQESLQDKANVLRPEENCGSTSVGLQRIDDWLGAEPWDVIHFNWGLHDLKWLAQGETNIVAGKKVEPGTGRQVAPPDVYQENLEKLITRLEATGATLVWCTTTPVPPEGAAGRRPGDSAIYNQAAAVVIARHPKIRVNDLYPLAKRLQPTLKTREANVHFQPEASRQFADQVVQAIEEALDAR